MEGRQVWPVGLQSTLVLFHASNHPGFQGIIGDAIGFREVSAVLIQQQGDELGAKPMNCELPFTSG
jgi:hypothetical protein